MHERELCVGFKTTPFTSDSGDALAAMRTAGFALVQNDTFRGVHSEVRSCVRSSSSNLLEERKVPMCMGAASEQVNQWGRVPQ